MVAIGKSDVEDWCAGMRLALAGDKDSYNHLLRDIAIYVKAIASSIFFHCNLDKASVDDVVQETLLAIHLHKERWDQRRKLKPWVATIAYYKCIDELRRIRKRRTLTLDEESHLGAVDPFQELQTGWAIAYLVDRLSPRQRDIVLSISIMGHTASETARRLSMSEVGVRVAFHRSLKKMAFLAADYRD